MIFFPSLTSFVSFTVRITYNFDHLQIFCLDGIVNCLAKLTTKDFCLIWSETPYISHKINKIFSRSASSTKIVFLDCSFNRRNLNCVLSTTQLNVVKQITNVVQSCNQYNREN